MKADEISFIPVGKIRCYITGKLRKDTPEEHVRQRVARSLVEEYGYSKEDIALEYRIKVGSKSKPIDIAVLKRDEVRAQENILIIAETKREEIKPTDRDNGIEQLKSYLAACPNTRWGLWVGSELQAYEIVSEKGQRHTIEIADIPPFGKTKPPRIRFNELMPAEGLRDVFRRCHNYIYANQGLPKDQAFHELLKLIFCKVHDEQTAEGEMRFDLTSEERRSELGQQRLRKRIENLFEEVREEYPYIFEEAASIKLNNRVLAYIVGELRRYSLLQTSTDVKGEAYQEIVRANLRGARGEFFTPPNVCRMAVEVAFQTLPRDRWSRAKILDPCCGTGGFLREVMNFWHKRFLEQYRQKFPNRPEKAEGETDLRLKEHCDRYLFGLDINPDLVRAAQMNLVMHGDGSTNAFQADSLVPLGELREEVQAKVKKESFDVVLTNPPFGTGPGLMVDDPHILDQFELVRFEANERRSAMPPEQIFIERCLQFVKPGGLLAIVLPDSILSNPGLLFIRRWLLKRTRVVASIDLPVETFLAFGGTGTQTSVLVVQKKLKEEVQLEEAAGEQSDYDIFMSVCKTMGYDRRGNDLWLRTPEGQLIEQEVTVSVRTRVSDGIAIYESKRDRRRVRDDQVSGVSQSYQEWRDQTLRGKGA